MEDLTFANSEAIRLAADASFFSSLEATTRFFLVRHGRSEGNAKGIVQGLLDLSLDEAGREEAAVLGAWLAGEGVESVFSSPLVRAAQTADIIAAAAKAGRPRLEPAFTEIDAGVFTGLSFAEAEERFPADYAAWYKFFWDGVTGASKAPELYARAMAAWALLREEALAGSKSIAVVSHGGFIQWLIRSTMGCRSWMPVFSVHNCGIFELQVEPCGPGSPAYLEWKRMNIRIC